MKKRSILEERETNQVPYKCNSIYESNMHLTRCHERPQVPQPSIYAIYLLLYDAMFLVIFPAESNVQQCLFGTDNKCTDVFLIFQPIINAIILETRAILLRSKPLAWISCHADAPPLSFLPSSLSQFPLLPPSFLHFPSLYTLVLFASR